MARPKSSDNGRGIPVDIHAEEGVSAAEVVMTQLHAGGKFANTEEEGSYKVSGGLHGVGVSVVNALSERLDLTIYRNGKSPRRCASGWASPKRRCASSAKRRRRPTARARDRHDRPLPAELRRPSPWWSSSATTLEHRLRELAFLNSGVKIVFQDLRGAEPWEIVMQYEGGVEAFVKHIDRQRNAAIPKPIYTMTKKDGVVVEAALQWNDGYYENVLCFTNNIPQRDGGTHLAGFRGALTRVINKYANETGLAKKEKVDISGDDAREGLTCVLSVKVPDPKFSVADQGQAGLVRSAPHRRKPDDGCAEPVVRGEPGPGQAGHAEDRRSRRRARSRPQGARTHAPQDRARHHLAARQARRLPGEGPGQVRTLHRRG